MGREARANPMSTEAKPLEFVVRDIFGRELKEGDEVFLGLKGPILFRIVKITPNLDPRSSPNLVYVEFGARAMFQCMREAKNQEFIRTRTEEEAGPSPWKVVEPPKGNA